MSMSVPWFPAQNNNCINICTSISFMFSNILISSTFKSKIGKVFCPTIFLNFEWCEHMKLWKAPAVLSTIYLISIAAAFLKSNANNSNSTNSNSMWECTLEKVKSWIKLPYYNVFWYGMITLSEGTLLIIIGYHNPWMHYYR